MLKQTQQITYVVTAVLVLFVAGIGMSVADVERSPRIIRPPDDRIDYYAASTALQDIGDSVCAQVEKSSLDLTQNSGSFAVIGDATLATDYDPLCQGEMFADQPTAAMCTATLIASDIVITAGHCLDDEGVRTDLNTVAFLFDYAIFQEGEYPQSFNEDQVYYPVEVLGLANVTGTPEDWAVVRLDRAVTGRTPVPVRSSGSVTVGQSIVAIGFGAGLPMKFSGNATVQSIVDFGFEADFDINGGNSGGPIVDESTGMIEGVLSADLAIDDYFDDGTCFRAAVCPQDPQCEDGFTSLSSVMTTAFQTAIQSAIEGSGGTGGNVNVPSPCGVVGIIPYMFMTFGLMLFRNRK